MPDPFDGTSHRSRLRVSKTLHLTMKICYREAAELWNMAILAVMQKELDTPEETLPQYGTFAHLTKFCYLSGRKRASGSKCATLPVSHAGQKIVYLWRVFFVTDFLAITDMTVQRPAGSGCQTCTQKQRTDGFVSLSNQTRDICERDLLRIFSRYEALLMSRCSQAKKEMQSASRLLWASSLATLYITIEVFKTKRNMPMLVVVRAEGSQMPGAYQVRTTATKVEAMISPLRFRSPKHYQRAIFSGQQKRCSRNPADVVV